MEKYICIEFDAFEKISVPKTRRRYVVSSLGFQCRPVDRFDAININEYIYTYFISYMLFILDLHLAILRGA